VQLFVQFVQGMRLRLHSPVPLYSPKYEPVFRFVGAQPLKAGINIIYLCLIFRLHRMHQMQTIVTDVRGVCLSVTKLNSALQWLCTF